jgi:tRNA(fMet)-specific endonuclease VapC
VRQQVPYYRRLVDLSEFYADWTVQPFDERAADEFLRLRREGVRIATMDLKIAAICLVEGATLLSANLKDFQQVPGLVVEDWLSH